MTTSGSIADIISISTTLIPTGSVARSYGRTLFVTDETPSESASRDRDIRVKSYPDNCCCVSGLSDH